MSRTPMRKAGASTVALLALLVLPCATAGAAGSSPSASATPAVYGQARDWGGTQIRSLDCPLPPAPIPAGCPANPPPQPGSGRNAAQSRAKATTRPRVIPPDQILSNEMSFTQWAYVTRIANVYWLPTTSSHRITSLHWYTEDGFDEIYILLRAHWDNHGREWVKIRIPARPNGQTGWVLRNALGRFRVTNIAVVVNRQTLHMYYYKDGRLVWSAPVGVGKPGTPTPAGHFWIREKFTNIPSSSGYWPYAFGTADYSTLKDWEGGGVVGIHGPYFAPSSAIPGRISHGCIRLHTWDDAWLGRHLQLGTPLLVV